MFSLKNNHSLQNGKYLIQSVLRQDSLSITYRALQTSLNRDVYITEFFMRDFCVRKPATNNVTATGSYAEQVEAFLKKFVADAKSKARNEVSDEQKVFDVFEENGTAYYVYLCDGDSTSAGEEKPAGEPYDEETVTVGDVKSADNEKTVVQGDINVGDNSNREQSGSRWSKKAVVAACIGIVALCSVVAYIIYTIPDGKTESNLGDKDTVHVAEDTVLVADTTVVDSVVSVEESKTQAYNKALKAEMEKYLRISKDYYEKAQKNRHKPGGVQNILDARYYYYDKADKINQTINGSRLPANKELDDITEDGYLYWVSEAKKLGSDRTKFAQKRKCLQRAKSLSFKHQNMLDAQIKWLDDQLKSKRRR